LNIKQGKLDDAISFLDKALKYFEDGGYKLETSNALLLTARAQRVKGEYQTALDTFNKQLQTAKDLGDPARIAASHSSIAFTLGELERYTEALINVDESYKINDSLGASVDKGTDLMNRGGFLWRLGRYREAEGALEAARATASGPQGSYKTLLGWILLTNSQLALSQMRFAEAGAAAQEALNIAATERIKDLACSAKYTIALAQASSGKAQSAVRACEEAVAIAEEVKSPRLRSSALLALGQVYLLRNDSQNALDKAREAQQMFGRAGQVDSEWQAWVIMARANQARGNKQEAQACASRADELCGSLSKLWGPEAYAGYLARPDIQNMRNHLEQILNRK
jgi:tetratricopeptide (TPR) repeat protein